MVRQRVSSFGQSAGRKRGLELAVALFLPGRPQHGNLPAVLAHLFRLDDAFGMQEGPPLALRKAKMQIAPGFFFVKGLRDGGEKIINPFACQGRYRKDPRPVPAT